MATWTYWTAAEDAILKEHYVSLGPTRLAAMLPGRSRISVQYRGGMLGLRRRPPRQFVGTPDAFGALLLAYREVRHLSISELARRTGVSHSLVSRFETGARLPSLATLVTLARALQLSPRAADRLCLAAFRRTQERRR